MYNTYIYKIWHSTKVLLQQEHIYMVGIGVTANGYRVLRGSDENVLNLDCVNGWMTLNILKIIELYI